MLNWILRAWYNKGVLRYRTEARHWEQDWCIGDEQWNGIGIQYREVKNTPHVPHELDTLQVRREQAANFLLGLKRRFQLPQSMSTLINLSKVLAFLLLSSFE